MNKKILFVLPIIALGLSACHESRTPNGKIPSQYVGQAQQYQGSYQGQFRGVPTTVGLYMDQDRPYVVVQNQQNNDLIGANCGSRVGQLSSVKGEQNQAGQGVLQTAKFDFSAGKCGVNQQVLRMDFSQNQRVIQARMEQSQNGINENFGDSYDSNSYEGEFVFVE